MKRPRAHMTGHPAAVGDTRTAEVIVSAAGECSVRVGGEDMYAVRPAMLYHHEGTITRDPAPILNWRSLLVSISFLKVWCCQSKNDSLFLVLSHLLLSEPAF